MAVVIEKAILDALIQAGKAQSVADIKDRVNCHERNIVEQSLLRLLRAGLVKMTHRGFEAVRSA